MAETGELSELKTRWQIDRVPPALVVLVLLGLFAFQAVHAMRLKGSTFDECAHLAAGYTYLVTGDFRMNPEHPPLAKELAALPLLLRDIHFSRAWPEWQTAEQWHLGRRFLYGENNANDLLFWGRVPIVLLSCLLGAFIYSWTLEITGRAAAFCSLLLFAFTPDFLAHGALVTTDLAAAAFSFMAFRFQWLLLQRLSVGRLALFGLALGAGLASKFNVWLFIPLFVLLPALRAWHAAPLPLQHPFTARERSLATRRERFAGLLCATLAAGCIAWLSIWTAYGWRSGLHAAHTWQDVAAHSPLLRSAIATARAWHVLPDAYLYGLLSALKHEGERYAFLLGEYSTTGWYSYFPITFLVKTPVPEIALIVAACALLPSQAKKRVWAYVAVAAPALLYFGVALSSNLNIGHRHLLPIYPFLIVLAGSAAAQALQHVWSSSVIAGLFAWLVWGTCSASPDYLPYFNEFVGGARGGLNVVVDSNLDWGQDLPELKRWMVAAHVPKIYLSYFGTGIPEFYGIDYESLPSFFRLPRPLAPGLDLRKTEYLAVSATNLQKIYLRDHKELAPFLVLLDVLRTREQPVVVLGGSIYVYRLHMRSAATPR
jgi:hypothetical protein